MPLKDIFLHADSGGDYKTRLETAVNLAAAHQAHLTAVYIPTLPKEHEVEGHPRQDPAASEVFLGETPRRDLPDTERNKRVMSDAYQRVLDDAEKAKALFEDQAGRAGVSHEWVYDESPMLDALALHARFCDLLVITQPTRKDTPEQLILTLGLPVLVVPNKGRFPVVGQRILIAWDRCPVALRAVNNERPFLRAGAEVKALSINLAPI